MAGGGVAASAPGARSPGSITVPGCAVPGCRLAGCATPPAGHAVPGFTGSPAGGDPAGHSLSHIERGTLAAGGDIPGTACPRSHVEGGAHSSGDRPGRRHPRVDHPHGRCHVDRRGRFGLPDHGRGHRQDRLRPSIRPHGSGPVRFGRVPLRPADRGLRLRERRAPPLRRPPARHARRPRDPVVVHPVERASPAVSQPRVDVDPDRNLRAGVHHRALPAPAHLRGTVRAHGRRRCRAVRVLGGDCALVLRPSARHRRGERVGPSRRPLQGHRGDRCPVPPLGGSASARRMGPSRRHGRRDVDRGDLRPALRSRRPRPGGSARLHHDGSHPHSARPPRRGDVLDAGWLRFGIGWLLGLGNVLRVADDLQRRGSRAAVVGSARRRRRGPRRNARRHGDAAAAVDGAGSGSESVAFCVEDPARLRRGVGGSSR